MSRSRGAARSSLRPTNAAPAALHAGSPKPLSAVTCPTCRAALTPASVALASGLEQGTQRRQHLGPLVAAARFVAVAARALALERGGGAKASAQPHPSSPALLRLADWALPLPAATAAADLLVAGSVLRLLHSRHGRSLPASLALCTALLALGALPLAQLVRLGLRVLCAASSAVGEVLGTHAADCSAPLGGAFIRVVVAFELAGSCAAGAMALTARGDGVAWAALRGALVRGEGAAALAAALLPFGLAAVLMQAAALASAFAVNLTVAAAAALRLWLAS